MTEPSSVHPVQLEWVGPVAFAAQHPNPPGSDLALGDTWGLRGGQSLFWRHDQDPNTGLLYAYDPLWGEYAVLATSLSPDDACDTCLSAVRDPHANTLEVFALIAGDRQVSHAWFVEPVGLEPEL